ncbi:MAG: YaiO family outer membrane beta-barrel protein [Pseudomonadota bacterium]
MKPISIILLCMFMQQAAWAADDLVVAQADNAERGANPLVDPPASANERSVEAEAGVSHENLTNGYASWNSIYVEGQVKLSQRQAYYGGLRATSRFSQNDSEMMAGASYPLSSRWSVAAEGSMSPSHHVLAKWSTLGQIQYAFDNGWGAHFGLRHSVYDNALTNLTLLTVERYWSNYLLSYTRYQSSLAGASGAGSNRVQFNRYYADRNWIGVSLAVGDELENTGAAGILRSHVHAVTLSGAHWLADRDKWAITYDIGRQSQGDLYTRTGARVGLRHQF